MAKTSQRSVLEKLTYLGIATFFLWPFLQIWSVKAIPVFETDRHLRASIALENLMEEALSMPFERSSAKNPFQPIKGCEDFGLSGKIEAFPHPDMPDNVLLRTTVKWGTFPFTKTLNLEYLRARNRP